MVVEAEIVDLILVREAVAASAMVRAPVCTGAAIGTFVDEALTVAMRIDVLFIVTDAAVDLLMCALTGIMDAAVVVDVNENQFTGATTSFERAGPGQLEESRL